MALLKGAKRCYNWLRTKHAGDVVTKTDVMQASEWSDVSLDTYLRKNKLGPFLLALEGDKLQVLQDGAQLSERYFDEVFTQTAPMKVILGFAIRSCS